MNPFTECTVARPLPADHRDRTWHRSNPDCNPVHTPDPDGPSDALQSSPDCHGLAKAGDARVRLHAGKVRTLGKRLTVALCVVFTAAYGIWTKPVITAGAVALAGMMTPRQAQAIDVNRASVQDLQALKGIGPKTAAMIVDERMRGGDFTSLSDLTDRVRGIGPKRAAALQAAGLKVTPGKTGSGKAVAPAAPRGR